MEDTADDDAVFKKNILVICYWVLCSSTRFHIDARARGRKVADKFLQRSTLPGVMVPALKSLLKAGYKTKNLRALDLFFKNDREQENFSILETDLDESAQNLFTLSQKSIKSLSTEREGVPRLGTSKARLERKAKRREIQRREVTSVLAEASNATAAHFLGSKRTYSWLPAPIDLASSGKRVKKEPTLSSAPQTLCKSSIMSFEAGLPKGDTINPASILRVQASNLQSLSNRTPSDL